jgi:hypothetical protein
MNDDWKRDPDGQGVGDAKPSVDSFASARSSVPEYGSGSTHCILSEHGIVRVSGADAKQFLQGQCTVDMDQLNQSNARLGAFCNPKGRVLTVALFVVDQADYLVRMPQANIESMLERLGRYVLRSQVKMVRDDSVLGVGMVSGEPLEAFATRLPGLPYDAVQSEVGRIVRVPGDPPRFEVYGSDEQLAGLLSRLSDSACFDAERWKLLNLKERVAEIFPTSSELFVPQMLDLERFGGVSFTKGCYTGQEIVARTQYLGRLKRRLVGARVSREACPLPGDTVFAPGHSGDREPVGRVVCAAADEHGGFELLAVVQNAALETQNPLLFTERAQSLSALRAQKTADEAKHS